MRRSAARSSRRPPAARSTGSRRRTRRTPGSSTSPENNGYSIFYLTDPDPRGSMGLGGKEEVARRHRRQLPDRDRLQDRARRAWRHKYEGGAGGGGGLLTTAGGLVFAGDGGGNLVAHDAATGKPLWHSRIGGVTNAPQTYMLDGRQYLLVARRRHAVCVRHVLIAQLSAVSSQLRHRFPLSASRWNRSDSSGVDDDATTTQQTTICPGRHYHASSHPHENQLKAES